KRIRVTPVPDVTAVAGTDRSASHTLAVLVTNDKDTGEGSLRQAITYANSHPGTKVRFPLDKWLTIRPASPLPPITANGTVLEVSSGTVNMPPPPSAAFGRPYIPTYTGPLTWILGDRAGKGADGLVVQGSNCLVRGVVISQFDHNQ